jgi:hypothetical protein
MRAIISNWCTEKHDQLLFDFLAARSNRFSPKTNLLEDGQRLASRTKDYYNSGGAGSGPAADTWLEGCWIRPSSSPASDPIMFVPKPNGERRLCVNYRGVSK